MWPSDMLFRVSVRRCVTNRGREITREQKRKAKVDGFRLHFSVRAERQARRSLQRPTTVQLTAADSHEPAQVEERK